MKGYNGSRQSQAWRCNFKSEPTSMACSQTQAFQHCCKDWWDQKFSKISRNFSKFLNYFLVPDDQLQTVFQYSKILEQNSSPTQGQLIEGNGLGQRSAALGRDTNSLLYPRCIKEPYKVWFILRLLVSWMFISGTMQSTRISMVLEHRRKRMCHLSIWGLCWRRGWYGWWKFFWCEFFQ